MTKLADWIRRHEIGAFFVITFAITWGILIPALSLVPDHLEILFIILAAFGPFLSAVITIRTSRGRAQLRRWLRQVFTLRIPAILYLTGAFLLPVGVGAMHYGLYTILGGRPAFSAAMPWYPYPIALIATALLTGGNEEPGWRGFALPALLERFHPVLATPILGVIHVEQPYLFNGLVSEQVDRVEEYAKGAPVPERRKLLISQNEPIRFLPRSSLL